MFPNNCNPEISFLNERAMLRVCNFRVPAKHTIGRIVHTDEAGRADHVGQECGSTHTKCSKIVVEEPRCRGWTIHSTGPPAGTQ